AEFLRPAGAQPALLRQPLLPVDQLFLRQVGVSANLEFADELGREVVLQPAANFALERELFLAEPQIHWGLLMECETTAPVPPRKARPIAPRAAMQQQGMVPVQPVASDEKLPASADVVVIGGGIAGVTAAYALPKKDLSVALLEKGVIAGEQ